MAGPATLGSTPRPRPVRLAALETQPFGAWPRLILALGTKLLPLLTYAYTASSQPPAAYSVWLFGAQTKPTCELSCWMTCFKTGLLLFAPLTSYKKRNCVEAAASILPIRPAVILAGVFGE